MEYYIIRPRLVIYEKQEAVKFCMIFLYHYSLYVHVCGVVVLVRNS
jgi:hypothetical protein